MATDTKFSIENEIILIFEPHPDDVAFNIMGSVCKWLAEDKQIYICTITKGNNSTFDPTVSCHEIERILLEEHAKVLRTIKLPPQNHIQWQYDDLKLDPLKHREPLLAEMIRLIRKIKPTTVITMDPRNIQNEENPDHRLVAMTGFEAAAMAAYPNFQPENGPQHFASRMLFYMTPEPDCFVDIEGIPLETKKNVAKIYKSQLNFLMAEINARLNTMGFKPKFGQINPENLWESVCESTAAEVALKATEYFRNNPELSPDEPIHFAEAFRMEFLGVVEKIRAQLPKDLFIL